MFMHSATPAILLAALSLPSAMAAQCSAVGQYSTNSAGFGSGGNTISNGGSLKLYDADSNEIGAYDGDKSVCSDLITFGSDSLDDTFSWGAACGGSGLSGCHGAYATQTHIEGEEPTSDTNFYGVGESVESECIVYFDC
ncbi:hypothetical protein N7481_007834 [Penicillium waksmanii]|uniref:uncharacterized protein n=1 Tax=Penicillium waksmanii TaxID=69791 RepID=UPI002549591C|nr:uncharacterized protein N7481_007834 [Penicillium waksmanii]KAJ5980536.1 hypothetical protein N7481_007834 [Penicillium waksmanii]